MSLLYLLMVVLVSSSLAEKDMLESGTYHNEYLVPEQSLLPVTHEVEEDGQYRGEIYAASASAIPGEAGVDYPIFASIPRTSFSCSDKLPGFYSDEEAFCQVWHYCKAGGIKESFLCPNGTIYSQKLRVCGWWFNVQCENSAAAYRVNEDLYIVPNNTERISDDARLREAYNENGRQLSDDPRLREAYNDPRQLIGDTRLRETYNENGRQLKNDLRKKETYNDNGRKLTNDARKSYNEVNRQQIDETRMRETYNENMRLLRDQMYGN